MPRHIVDRTPVDPFMKPDLAHRRSLSRTDERSSGLGLLWAIITITVICGSIGYVFHLGCQRLAETSAALDDALAHGHWLAARLSQSSAALNDAEVQLSDTQTLVQSTKQDLARQTAQTVQLKTRLDARTDQFRALQSKHRATLNQMAEIVVADPRLMVSMLDESSAFANLHDLNETQSNPSLRWRTRFSPIPVGTTISVLSLTELPTGTVWDVAVTSLKGEFVFGLHRGDFEIYDAARRQHAVTIETSSRQFAVQEILILLDRSASTEGPRLQAAKSAVNPFVKAVADPALVQVASFGDDVTLLSGWQTQAEIHCSAIAKLTSQGGTSLYRALIWGAGELKSRTDQRCIVLFTDGNDSRRIETLDQAITACRSQKIPVHVVALTGGDTNETVLRRIAHETNGVYCPVTDPAELTRSFQAIARQLQQPVYRIHVAKPFDSATLTVQLGQEQPVALCPGGTAQSPTLAHVLPVPTVIDTDHNE